jgi:hypothetical protein
MQAFHILRPLNGLDQRFVLGKTARVRAVLKHSAHWQVRGAAEPACADELLPRTSRACAFEGVLHRAASARRLPC